MKYQKHLSEVFDKFKINPECLQYFLNSTEIPELQNLRDLQCSLFFENSFVQSVNTEHVDGFVMGNRQVSVFFISPSDMYLRFWGFRNFLTYRLAKKHHQINDGILRYVVNIHNKDGNNRTDTFNDIREFQVINIYKKSEDLQNWLYALYEDVNA